MNDLIYEGKAKSIFKHKEHSVIQFFKDSVTAFNNPQPYFFEGKGAVSSKISSAIFKYLENNDIKTHLIGVIDNDKQIVQKLNILPIEVTVRNYAFGGILKKSHFKEGERLSAPIIEFMYKNDALGDPLISDSYVLYYLLNGNNELFEKVKFITMQINQFLIKFFIQIDIILGDFKVEFGINHKGELLLGDEISCDTCRLLDIKNNLAPLDKDILRKNLGNLMDGYNEVSRRIEAYYN